MNKKKRLKNFMTNKLILSRRISINYLKKLSAYWTNLFFRRHYKLWLKIKNIHQTGSGLSVAGGGDGCYGFGDSIGGSLDCILCEFLNF
jgi:hypothetical protein